MEEIRVQSYGRWQAFLVRSGYFSWRHDFGQPRSCPVKVLPSDSRASSVSGHSIGPSFMQFQTESYTASRPSLSLPEPDENRVDSNRTSATPYSFGSRAEKVRWRKHRRVYRRVHAQAPNDMQTRVLEARVEK